MAYRYFFATLSLILAGVSVAQDKCLSSTITERWLEQHGQHVDLAAEATALEQGNIRGGGLLTIPVAVHVVWNTTAENVSNTVIQNIIAQMNADYQAMNADYNSVRPTFAGSRANVGIEFCLASVDPNGNATDGITRTNSTETWFNPDTETDDMKSAPKGIAPWTPTQYLNIWICDIASGLGGGLITTGYAYLPVGGMVGSSIDGIVIDYNYGLDAGARTATHEAGHYLGLQHPWGSNGGCVDDDGFSDTPDTEGPTFSCTPTNQTSCGVLTQYENFMDYSSCSCMFTDQQGAEMTDVLTGVRSGLLSSSGCSSTTTGPCIPASLTGTDDGDFIDGVVLGTINNTASGSTGGASYTNYSSSESTVVQPGTTYTISITGGDYQPDHYAAWIDYDQDDTFEASEKLGQFSTTEANESQLSSFEVPVNAPLGNTTMRVRGVFIGDGEPADVDPCFNYAYGETEDYGITIAAAPSIYCTPVNVLGPVDGDFIDDVVIGNIVNLNTGGVEAPAYTDYSSTQNTTVERGSEYTLVIGSGDYTPDVYAAWIDMNLNGVFEPSESLGQFTNTVAGGSGELTFTVPQSASIGESRLRVRGQFVAQGEPNPIDPCYAYAYGETEDYKIFIQFSTSVTEAATANVSVWPNPTTGLLNVGLGQDGSALIEVLDMQGRMVMNTSTTGQLHQLDASALAAGTYVVRVSQSGAVSNSRIEVLKN